MTPKLTLTISFPQSILAPTMFKKGLPNIMGQNIANPIATILSGKLMLEWLANQNPEVSTSLLNGAKAIDEAVTGLLKDSDTKTPDLGGKAGTTDVGAAIAGHVASRLRQVEA